MKLLKLLAIAAIAGLSPLAHADANAPKAGPTKCQHGQGIRVEYGCSLYHFYRDSILAPDLPTQFHLPDTSEHSWIITVLGLTIFTEARMENLQSMTAVAASILNRAHYGRPDFTIETIPDLAANTAYSQWLQTWASEMKVEQGGPGVEDINDRANLQIMKKPLEYAGQHQKMDYPHLMARSVELARCIIVSAEGPSPAADLAWVKEFGTRFINPTLVSPDTGNKSPCHEHSDYLSTAGRAYCPFPAKSLGICSEQPRARDTSNICGGGSFSSAQHYELATAHSEEQIKALNSQIQAFMASCKTGAP